MGRQLKHKPVKRDPKKIQEQIKKHKVEYVHLQFTDLLGIVKSVSIPANKLTETIKNGKWFDGSSIEGFARIQESDMILMPDLNTFALIPWLKPTDSTNSARIICDVYTPKGEPYRSAPRNILKRALAEAKEQGFEYMVGPELEFYLFKKVNGPLSALPHDVGSYFDFTADQAAMIRMQMVSALRDFGIDVECSHHEVGKGQHEIGFRYADALTAADSGTTLRLVLKAIAQEHDLIATFMPKPIETENGSGMHVHQSLFRKGRNCFYSEKDKYNLSKKAYGFIAGQLKYISQMCAVLSPLVNSYKRLVPGFEAPVFISWARQNRSALIRIPEEKRTEWRKKARIELRSPDPSCNLHLAFAVMLKAGLEGIKQKLTPPEPIEEDVYKFDDKKLEKKRIDTLPASLEAALECMRNSELVKQTLGEDAFRKYMRAKMAEWRRLRKYVTPLELDMYLNY